MGPRAGPHEAKPMTFPARSAIHVADSPDELTSLRCHAVASRSPMLVMTSSGRMPA